MSMLGMRLAVSDSANLCCALAMLQHYFNCKQADVGGAAQAKRYAFKCHRKSDTGQDTVYPVNALAFHPSYGTFASGGVLSCTIAVAGSGMVLGRL